MATSNRPDLRQLLTNVRDAFADADRETLLDVLTFVVQEYVVEGPPPMLVQAVENLEDLKGHSFAQLISALQTRLDVPELALFAVDGDHVSVRVGGVMHPLHASKTAPAPLPAAAPAPAPVVAAADLPRPAAGVRIVEAEITRAPQPPPAAPRPTAGLAVRSAPAVASTPAPAPGAAAPEPAPEKKSDSDASTRFSLLELD